MHQSIREQSFLSRIRGSRIANLVVAAALAMPLGFGQQRTLQAIPNAVGERLVPPPRPKKRSLQEIEEAAQWAKLRHLDAEAKRLKRQARNKRNALYAWQRNNAHDLRFWPFSANAERYFEGIAT